MVFILKLNKYYSLKSIHRFFKTFYENEKRLDIYFLNDYIEATIIYKL